MCVGAGLLTLRVANFLAIRFVDEDDECQANQQKGSSKGGQSSYVQPQGVCSCLADLPFQPACKKTTSADSASAWYGSEIWASQSKEGADCYLL